MSTSGLGLLDTPPVDNTPCDRLHLYLLVPRARPALARCPVPGLHLQHGAEQLLRGLRQEADLSVGMQAVQVGRLGRERVVDVLEQRTCVSV